MPPAPPPRLLQRSLLVPLPPPSLARAPRSLRRPPVGAFSARSRRPLPHLPHLTSSAAVLSLRRRPSPPPPPLLQEVACLALSPPPRQLLRVPPRLLPRLPRHLVACSEMPAHQPPLHLPRRPLRLRAEACSERPRPPLSRLRHLPVLRRLPRPSRLGPSSGVLQRPLRHSRLRQRRQAPLLRPQHPRRRHRLLRLGPVHSAPSPPKVRPPLLRNPRNNPERLPQPPVPTPSVLRPPARPRGSQR